MPRIRADERLRMRVLWLLRSTDRTQHDLATMLGLTQPDISRRCTGLTPFRLRELDGIAAFFGLRVADLFVEWGESRYTPPDMALTREAPSPP